MRKGIGEAEKSCAKANLYQKEISAGSSFFENYLRNEKIMEIRKIEINDRVCAVVESDTFVIEDTQSALDLLMMVNYEVGTKNIAIDKELVVEDFFVLSSGLAGEILQKYVNYGGRIAIYGDFSHYTSKALRDFIYESNKGRHVCFVATEAEAVDMLVR